MSATFNLDIKPWADQVRKLDKRLATKTFPELLKQQGKLFVRDLILATPPFDKTTIDGPLNAQRKVGVQAVTTDTKRLFQPMPKVDTLAAGDKRAAFALRKYIRTGALEALSTMLRRLGALNSGVVYEATEALQTTRRNAKGRIPKKGFPIIVLRGRTILALVNLLKGHVGKLKAGWMPAAKKLGVSVPAWISKHSTPGSVHDNSRKLGNPSIMVSNNSAFGPQVEHKIVEYAIEKRRGSMQKQIEALVNAETAKM